MAKSTASKNALRSLAYGRGAALLPNRAGISPGAASPGPVATQVATLEPGPATCLDSSTASFAFLKAAWTTASTDLASPCPVVRMMTSFIE
jgi:hypothetical protein